MRPSSDRRRGSARIDGEAVPVLAMTGSTRPGYTTLYHTAPCTSWPHAVTLYTTVSIAEFVMSVTGFPFTNYESHYWSIIDQLLMDYWCHYGIHY